MSTETETPTVLIASIQWIEGTEQAELVLETKDRVKATFKVDPMGVALLGLTIGPTMKLMRAYMDEQGLIPGSPTAPESTEGLEG